MTVLLKGTDCTELYVRCYLILSGLKITNVMGELMKRIFIMSENWSGKALSALLFMTVVFTLMNNDATAEDISPEESSYHKIEHSRGIEETYETNVENHLKLLLQDVDFGKILEDMAPFMPAILRPANHFMYIKSLKSLSPDGDYDEEEVRKAYNKSKAAFFNIDVTAEDISPEEGLYHKVEHSKGIEETHETNAEFTLKEIEELEDKQFKTGHKISELENHIIGNIKGSGISEDYDERRERYRECRIEFFR